MGKRFDPLTINLGTLCWLEIMKSNKGLDDEADTCNDIDWDKKDSGPYAKPAYLCGDPQEGTAYSADTHPTARGNDSGVVITKKSPADKIPHGRS
jgi:hypothetical protein